MNVISNCKHCKGAFKNIKKNRLPDLWNVRNDHVYTVKPFVLNQPLLVDYKIVVKNVYKRINLLGFFFLVSL